MDTRRHDTWTFIVSIVLAHIVGDLMMRHLTVFEEQRYFNREFDLIVANYV